MSFPRLIFVYGTLMHGLSNHYLLLDCKFCGYAETIENFALFVIDYPIVTSTIRNCSIRGELYEVLDQTTLDKLDQLEEHPNWYERRQVAVSVYDKADSNKNRQEVIAELYFNDRYDLNRVSAHAVPSGSFRDYPEIHAFFADGGKK